MNNNNFNKEHEKKRMEAYYENLQDFKKALHQETLPHFSGIENSLIISAAIANNSVKMRFREDLVDYYKAKGLFIKCIESYACQMGNKKGDLEDSYDLKFAVYFTQKQAETFVFKDWGENNHDYDLPYNMEKFIELGIHGYTVYHQAQKLQEEMPGLIPIEQVATVYNGGSLIQKSSPVKNEKVINGRCLTALYCHDNRFVFKNSEIPEAELIPKKENFPTLKNCILVAAAARSMFDLGFPMLVIDQDKPIYVSNSVHVIKFNKDYPLSYLAHVVQFMLTNKFNNQLMLDFNKPRPALSVKNLRLAMIPEPGSEKGHERELSTLLNKIAEANDNVCKQNIALKAKLKSYNKLVEQNFKPEEWKWVERDDSIPSRYPD